MAQGADNAKTKKQAAVVPPQAQPATPTTTNLITIAASKQGVNACAGRIEQVTNYLGFTPNAGAMLMLPQGNADKLLLPVVMELPMDGNVAFASASFAPKQANGCGSTYDAVVYWPEKCDVIARRQFGNLKNVGLLKQTITVLDGGTAMKVFLMPAGSGCVSIKKEIVL